MWFTRCGKISYNRDIPFNVTSAHVLHHKDTEESLPMGYIYENMPLEEEIKYFYLFIDWIDKYITGMEAQGCTSLARIYTKMFDMHSLKERIHDFPISRKYLDLNKVAYYISYGSANKIYYSSIYCVDRGIMEIQKFGR